MGSFAVGPIVSAALDPVLTPAGFTAGQYGDDTQVIFCAGHDDLSDRFPWLPQANSQQRDEGACTDLMIDATDDGRFDAARFEELSLEETLRTVGHTDAAEDVRGLGGATLDRALPVLAATLTRLFTPVT
jgi:hypothetical protein